MEDFNAPIAVCDTLLTKEKYARAIALMQRGTKAFPIIYIVCGALIVNAMLLAFLGSLFLPDELPFELSDILFLALGVLFLFLGIYSLVIRKKQGAKNYELYLSLNPDPRVHAEFFADRFVISNTNEKTTRYYTGVVSWAESDDIYFLYYGSRFKKLAVFLFKDSFVSAEDQQKFVSLMQTVLAGKKYKRIKG